MWTRLALIAAVWLVAGPAAAASNDDCLTCHTDQKAIESSIHGPLACVDCHSALAATKEFPHATPVDTVKCAGCHDDIGPRYGDSIHAWAKAKAGLVAAPACAECHGKHDIKAHTDPASRVHRTRIPQTCGSCHPRVVESFRKTFHGKVSELGFTRVAACADCHGAHDILPPGNPASTVSKARLVETCSRCHPGANERFVAYDPHPNPRDYHRNKVLWAANIFYWMLIPSCFGFFGLHSALWLYRSRKESRHAHAE